MINLLTVAGGALVAVGVVLSAYNLIAAAASIGRRHAYRKRPLVVPGEGIYAGAMTAAEVYVPGTIRDRLVAALLAVVMAAVGVPVLGAGIALAAYARVDSAQVLAVVREAGDGVTVSPAIGRAITARRPGPVLVAHAEFIDFHDALARLGLGCHARLIRVSGYASAADVLSRRPIAGVVVHPQGALMPALGWVSDWAPTWVQTTRRFSTPMPRRDGEATLWASCEGLNWR